MTEEITFDDDGNPVSLNSRGVTPINPITGEGLFLAGTVIGKDGSPLMALTAVGEGNRTWHNDRAQKGGYRINWNDGSSSHPLGPDAPEEEDDYSDIDRPH